MKAKFIRREFGGFLYGKKQPDRLIYEYRGREYDVTDYGWREGCDPLKWQHGMAQAEIDDIIDGLHNQPKADAKGFDIDEIFNLLGWD